MKELVTALAKAQANMKNAPLNKVNPHFKSKYADLASIRDAVIPPLTEQGIALVQTMETDETGKTYVVTVLLKGEENITSKTPIQVMPNSNAQQFGSALTYAKRYGMAAICGISADDDDDGNAATKQTDAQKEHEKEVKAKLKAREYAQNFITSLQTPETEEALSTHISSQAKHLDSLKKYDAIYKEVDEAITERFEELRDVVTQG